MLHLKRPLVFLDLETTGTDVAKDRIVEIAFVKVMPDGATETLPEFKDTKFLINPGMPIPIESSMVHGIYDADVAGKDLKAAEEAARDYLVEHKRDVIILLDSVTRLGRAYNTVVPSSGKVLTGGVDANALQRPKLSLSGNTNIGRVDTALGTASFNNRAVQVAGRQPLFNRTNSASIDQAQRELESAGLRLETAHHQPADLLLEVDQAVGIAQRRQVRGYARDRLGQHILVLHRLQRHPIPPHRLPPCMVVAARHRPWSARSPAS